jgi:hypothetical protein
MCRQSRDPSANAARRARPILGALAASLALVVSPAARAGPPGAAAVLDLAASHPLADPPGAEGRQARLPVPPLKLEEEEADEGAEARLPIWIHRRFSRWDTYDGIGYRVRSSTGADDGWFLGGELERREGPEPLVIEAYEEPDSPRRRVVGENALAVGAVLDLSELPHLLLALGAGGGARHLHAYLGWQVTVGWTGSGG